jgi:RimJ/RimL family protein N-acetyltransferase
VNICQSTRLRLAELSEDDAPFILQLLTDPDFLRNIGDRGVSTLEEARTYITTVPRASYQKYGFGLYRVELKETALPIGICGLLRRDWHPDVELGFAFLPEGRGKGYATEAARMAVEFGQCTLGLSRLVAITAPDNLASAGVLAKVGFRFERETSRGPGGPSVKLFVLE